MAFPMDQASGAPGITRRTCLALVGASVVALGSRGLAGAREVLKVGSTLALPPFEFVDQAGVIQGFEIDLVRAICDRLGYEPEFVKTPFSQAFVGLAAGRYRLNASNIFIRCERIAGPGQVGRFTVPTFDVGLSIVTRAERPEASRTLEGLRGLDVGVESRGTGADLLADQHKDALGFRKVVFDNTGALFLALDQGRIGAAIQSEPVARYALRERPALVAGPVLPGTGAPVGLLFRKDDPLRAQFNATIDALKGDGTTRRLYERWFGTSPDSRSAVVRVVPEITPETCRGAAVLPAAPWIASSSSQP
jgi:ABC-type amino acid transport substrate-binding protein